MAKPATRLPKATPAPAAAAAPARTVRPAADNGVPFADRKPTRSEPVKRRGKQISARIPDELYARLLACSAETRIPQGRLLERGLDAELKSHGF